MAWIKRNDFAEYKGVGKQDYNCAFAYWDDDDINDDLSPHISGPYCGNEKAKAPYGGGAGACDSKNCKFWRLRGREDHAIEKPTVVIDNKSELRCGQSCSYLASPLRYLFNCLKYDVELLYTPTIAGDRVSYPARCEECLQQETRQE